MEPKPIYEILKPKKVKLDEILIDPNNPRFSELGQEIDLIPEERFGEEGVQNDALNKMKSTGKFEVAELRDTIKTLGFLPMDRIVIRPWKSKKSTAIKYVVLEGNRRITALKWLMELHKTGKEELSINQQNNFTEIEALLLDDTTAPDAVRWIIPGLRHVSGIKEWGAYQKAKAVFSIRKLGRSTQDTAQSLGLSVREANRLWRAYLALEQMKSDEEYGDYVDAGLYSYFEEIFKRPKLREWLKWDDEAQKFTNAVNLREIYGWIVGEPNDDGELGQKKLPEAKSIRVLDQIIDDAVSMAVLKSENGTLTKALARYETEHPDEWLPLIRNAENVLATMSADTLKKLTAQELESLEKLRKRIETIIADRKKLTE